MGYMRHHGILVTSWNDEFIEQVHAKALEIFDLPNNQTESYELVSAVTPAVMNGYRSFAVFPDGSKEGWETSDEYEIRREQFIAYLKTRVYEDGSGPLSWVLIQYGDDDGGILVLDSDVKAISVG